MKYDVVIQPLAIHQLEETYEWILNSSSERAAAKWYNGLIDTIVSLEHNPKRAMVAPEGSVLAEEIRVVLHGRGHNIYRIYFTIKDHTVQVLQIRHGRRLPPTAKELLDVNEVE